MAIDTEAPTRARPTATPTQGAAPATRAGTTVVTSTSVKAKFEDWAAANGQFPILHLWVVRRPTVEELEANPNWRMAGRLFVYAINWLLVAFAVAPVVAVAWTVCHTVMWLIGHPLNLLAGLVVSGTGAGGFVTGGPLQGLIAAGVAVVVATAVRRILGRRTT